MVPQPQRLLFRRLVVEGVRAPVILLELELAPKLRHLDKLSRKAILLRD